MTVRSFALALAATAAFGASFARGAAGVETAFAARALAVSSSGCYPAGSRTLLAERTLRVYRTRLSGSGEEASDEIVACWRSSGRRTEIVAETPEQANNEVRLVHVEAASGSTSVIGAEVSTVGVGLAGTDLVESFDVSSGRRLASNEAELRSCREGCRVYASELAVAPSGALAFVGAVSAARDERPEGLYVKGVGRSLRLLETGESPGEEAEEPNVIAGVSIAGEVVSWRANGVRKHALLVQPG
jgi:hypothetical protein